MNRLNKDSNYKLKEQLFLIEATETGGSLGSMHRVSIASLPLPPPQELGPQTNPTQDLALLRETRPAEQVAAAVCHRT